MTTLLYHECTWTEKTPDACPACSGEVCWLCGAGTTGFPTRIECTHDSLERHSYYQDKFEIKLTDLIAATARELRSRFPGCRVQLSDFRDPESGEVVKRLSVVSGGPVADPLERWERFQDEWWLDRMDPRLAVDLVFAEAIPHGAEMECPSCFARCHHDRETPDGQEVAPGACWWNERQRAWECTECMYK